jgi:proline dehydrogenase
MLRSLFINLSTNQTARNFATNFGPSRRMARRFVAGETLDEAVEVVKTLNQQGIKAILNHVGESVSTRQEASMAAEEIIHVAERIEAEGLDSSVTIKPSHVGLAFGMDFCYENIADVVQVARQRDILVEIDIEGSSDVDATLQIYHRLLNTFGHGVRQAIQTYLHRTPADLEAIIAAGGSVRLVKGAYKEPPEIALQGRNEINQASLRAIKMFFTPEAAARGAYLSLGSHDPVLIEGLLAEAAAQGASSEERYEVQMLQGVRRDEQQRLAAQGIQVRTYVPFGTAWYPYFMRRLAERPANVLFIARAMLGG